MREGHHNMDADQRAAVEKRLRDEGIETVLCVVPDLWGRLMGKRVTTDSFLKTALRSEGLHASLYLFVVDMDMDPRPGYQLSNWHTGFSDFRMVPDLTTFRPVPWLDATAIVICDACAEDGDELVEVAPRTILRRQVERAAAAGLRFKMATELEFYLYRTPPAEAWARRYLELEPVSYYRADYHILASTRNDSFVEAIRRQMNEAGIEVEFSKSEWGLGQQEINLRYADALEIADRHALYKNGVKEMAHQRDWSATFMAKPSIAEIGSSCHIHASVWGADDTTAMPGPSSAHDLSVVGRSFLGGLLEHTAELMWLFAPNVNSYKRFQSESFAPTVVAWGRDNRTCGYRVVGEGESLRVENRMPGADVNPYLSCAATVIAGLDGIERGLDCGDPYEGNAYTEPGLAAVPTTLRDGLEGFSRSTLAATALGGAVHEHLVNFARQELEAFQHECVTDWERVRYFERI
jgi:glutamine synthetase